MRYILDSSGYIEEISFSNEIVCHNDTCTEYTGSIPSGYNSLSDWSTNANIRAYKIVNGNLTYDSTKDSALQSEWASQEESNTPELSKNKVTSISSSSTDTQYPSAKCVYDELSDKQDTLESGTNIKTINNTSLLGSGNISIPKGDDGNDGYSPTVAVHSNTDTEYTLDITDKNGTITTPNLKGSSGSGSEINVYNTNNTSTTDTYSCNYINENFSDKTIDVRTAGTNLNDYIENGRYYFGSDYTPTNIPVGTNGWLEVIACNGKIRQLWFRQGTANTNDWNFYQRSRMYDGTWSNWRRYIVDNDSLLFYKAGDSVTTYDYDCAGYTTGAGQYIYVSVPMAKRLDNVSSATISGGTLIARQNGSYLEGASSGFNVAATAYTVKCWLDKKSNALEIEIYKKNSAFTNVTNNDTVGLRVRSFVITFS